MIRGKRNGLKSSKKPGRGVEIRRGDIFSADLSPVIGSEQGGLRPVLIIQNDVGNLNSPTTIIAPITSQNSKAKLPTHVELPGKQSNLSKDSLILAEQIRTIDKTRLKEKICTLNDELMGKVDQALRISVGLVESERKRRV